MCFSVSLHIAAIDLYARYISSVLHCTFIYSSIVFISHIIWLHLEIDIYTDLYGIQVYFLNNSKNILRFNSNKHATAEKHFTWHTHHCLKKIKNKNTHRYKIWHYSGWRHCSQPHYNEEPCVAPPNHLFFYRDKSISCSWGHAYSPSRSTW